MIKVLFDKIEPVSSRIAEFYEEDNDASKLVLLDNIPNTMSSYDLLTDILQESRFEATNKDYIELAIIVMISKYINANKKELLDLTTIVKSEYVKDVEVLYHMFNKDVWEDNLTKDNVSVKREYILDKYKYSIENLYESLQRTHGVAYTRIKTILEGVLG